MAKRYKPTPAQLGKKVGKVYEDGSFRTKGGGKFDPESGKIRAKPKPYPTPAQTYAGRKRGRA